ncbi:probable starch synthase 4, chloroplastic/amyloplastic isoform X2 [Cornus florida]|uniref:probable starch synthase 4, chloroplastic/amyloplastic isoform X2 n=1 Tax=Cornus florida TaxID=4283 RepID=UPI0028980761|nr:probable starch synthase 4, chloroplastic/amyloplastic isoform X2 [Cornus florida]
MEAFVIYSGNGTSVRFPHTSLTGCSSFLDHHLSKRIVEVGNTERNNKKTFSLTRSKPHWSNFKLQALQVGADKTEGSTSLGFKDIAWPSPSDEIPFWKRDFPSWDISSKVPVDIEKDSDLMHIVHVTAEMAPIAKVGGLGDVVTGLAHACLLRGHKVDIMLPFYECIQKQQIDELALITSYNSYHDGNWVPTSAYHGIVSGIPVIFIETSNYFFKGKSIYGGSYNELEAYLFFTRACLEWMQVTGTQPDIIHVHEWQTGALPLLYWDMYHHLSLQKPRIALTIHNMEHYGECSKEQLSKCGLDGSLYATIDKAVDERTIGHNPERLSILKGGIVYSNAVVTVSPTYLKETLCSGWLASTLIRQRDKYCGILNGIDTEIWNPATDVFLPAKFHAHKTEGKKICKHFIQRGLGFPSEGAKAGINVPDITSKVPLVVCVTRLVAQKGLHLINHAIKLVEELPTSSSDFDGCSFALMWSPFCRVDRWLCLEKLQMVGLKKNLKILQICTTKVPASGSF